ncbi:MAG: hypothetical protein ABSG92_07340 [Conexivisphaerales archaeon]|jgi:hypothetical protein
MSESLDKPSDKAEKGPAKPHKNAQPRKGQNAPRAQTAQERTLVIPEATPSPRVDEAQGKAKAEEVQGTGGPAPVKERKKEAPLPTLPTGSAS